MRCSAKRLRLSLFCTLAVALVPLVASDLDDADDLLNDGEPIMQYECHEGNYGLRNILSAARAEEKAQENT